jgi:hypothetical protein
MADLTAIAAFTAAGLSLANVGITARVSRAGSLEEWRRNEERPVAARIVRLTEECRDEWGWAESTRQVLREARAEGADAAKIDRLHDMTKEHIAAAQDARVRVLEGVAELQLMAGRPLREAALLLQHALGRASRHYREANELDIDMAITVLIDQTRSAFIHASRIDLGIDRPPPSLRRWLHRWKYRRVIV